MSNIAVILAGGSGSRMHDKAVTPTDARTVLPKQFLPLSGRTVIEHSIDTFNQHPAIDEVAIVVNPMWRNIMEEIANQRRWQKLNHIIDGGSERYLSTLNAIMAFINRPDNTNILFHDAARPLVSTVIIDRVIAALQHSEAVGVAIPSTDTIWEVHPDMSDNNGDNIVARIPERRIMWQAQTPQAFRLPLIRDAYQRALQDPQFTVTDDCSVIRRYMPCTKIVVVEGDDRNLKITTSNDLKRIEYFL